MSLIVLTAFTAAMLSQALPAWWEDQPAASAIGRSVPGSVFEGELTSVAKDRFTLMTRNPTGAAAPQVFLIPADTPITMNGRPAQLSDLKPGSFVRVTGTQTEDGLIVADCVDVCTTGTGSGSGGRQASNVIFVGGGGGGGGVPGVFPPGVIPPPVVLPIPPVNVPPIVIPSVVVPPVVVVVPPVVGLPNLPELPTLPVLPGLPTLPGVPPVGCINCPKPLPRDSIGATIEAVLQVEADLKAQVGEQVQIATGLVDQLLTGDCNIIDVSAIVVPKLQHLCNILQSTIGTTNDATAEAKVKLVVALQVLTNTLQDCGSDVPQTALQAKALLEAKLNIAATAADHLVDVTKVKADSAISLLAICLHGAADSAKDLTLNVAAKVIATETKLAHALLGTISPCDGLVSDIVTKVDAKKALVALTLHRTADFVQATIGGADDKAIQVKAQLVAALHDCGNSLEVAIAAVEGKVEDARTVLAVKLDVLSDAVQNYCGVDGVSVDGAKGLLIAKTHLAAAIVRELLTATGGKVALIEVRLAQALQDIGNSCGVIVPELVGKVGHLKLEVAGLLNGQTDLSQDLRAQIARLLRVDLDLDATLSRQLCDAILSGVALDADLRAQLARLIAVDIDIDALTDASLVHGLVAGGELNLAVLARLAPVLFTDADLDAVLKINLARMLRGEVLPNLALGADVHARLLGLLLDKIDQDCGPVATLAILLRTTANSLEQGIGDAPGTVLEVKADLIAKLQLAADNCDNLVAAIKLKLGDSTDDAKQVIAAAHVKLVNALGDALTSCNQLGELLQGGKHDAVLLIAASLHAVKDAAQGLIGLTGNKLHAAEQKLFRVIEDAKFRVGLLIFMTNERIATLESHLSSKLTELAHAVQCTIANPHDTVGAAKALVVLKLLAAADAARDLAAALKVKTGDLISTADDTVKVKVALLAEKLDDAVGSCNGLVTVLKGTAGSVEAKLAVTLNLVAEATHDLANGVTGKIAVLEAKLCDVLQSCLVDAPALVADLKGTVQDKTTLLGQKLREAAILLTTIVDEKKDVIADAKAHAIEKLLAAAAAADALADCYKDAVGETVGGVKLTIEEAQAKLAAALADASCACGLLATVTHTAQTAVTVVGHKLAWTLATASGAVHGLIGVADDKLAFVNQLADSLSCACLDINHLIALLPATPGQLPSHLLPAIQIGGVLDAQARGELARIVLAQLELDAEARAHLTRQLLTTVSLDGDAQTKLASILQLQAGAVAKIETLLHGPVHEAFMNPFSTNTLVGELVTTTPPAPLVENVPQLAQHSDALQFIKGYWSLNPETHKFVWVTGTLRNGPPGHTWMASVWEKVDGGFRRTPGAWVPNGFDITKATVPVPPVAKQIGPIGNAPSANHVWLPGHWNHNNGQFVWKPGFWGQGNSNWVWTAPRYIQTVHGAVLISGFWDRPITERGLLFAPLHVHNIDSLQSATTITPNVVVNTSRMMLHLFAGSDRLHYLFGDFHAAEFTSLGILPWFENTGLGQDPLLVFHGRQVAGVDLTARLRSWHRYFQNNPAACPPRTLADFKAFIERNANNRHALASLMVANLNDPVGDTSQIVLAGGTQTTGGVLSASSVPGVGLTNFGLGGAGGNIPGSGLTGGMNLPSVNGLGGVGGLPGVGGAGGLSLPGVGGLGGGAGGLPGVGGLGGGGLPGVGGGGLPGVGGLGGGGLGLPGGGGAGGLGLPGGGVGGLGLPKP
ncbi:MAG: YXWGXW repeat-containing protein [Planctomycetaceae bacterium]|nr:YXWGXW repeat-containing protein [Planctomycetaceae bacterium]